MTALPGPIRSARSGLRSGPTGTRANKLRDIRSREHRCPGRRMFVARQTAGASVLRQPRIATGSGWACYSAPRGPAASVNGPICHGCLAQPCGSGLLEAVLILPGTIAETEHVPPCVLQVPPAAAASPARRLILAFAAYHGVSPGFGHTRADRMRRSRPWHTGRLVIAREAFRQAQRP